MSELFSSSSSVELPASADFHVHLRDGDMMRTVVPMIKRGGVDMVYVMPNLIPPVTTVERALEYQKDLKQIDSSITYLMTLYLHPSITPETIRQAKQQGIRGVKSYPAGVTTNSSSGVVDYVSFYPVFEEMEKQGLVLNLHGESPSGKGVSVLNAEERFLPTLKELHTKFPKLRIVLEHCTTAAAVDAVKSCGPTVVGTITAHHLFLTVDDWASDPFCFCKPVAKTPEDRAALVKAAVSNNPKFFLGSDSAPHPSVAKRGGPSGMSKTAAGVFTQPFVTQYTLQALESAVAEGIIKSEEVSLTTMKGFLGEFGREFYGEPRSDSKIKITKSLTEDVPDHLAGVGEIEVVPFLRGSQVMQLEWV